MPAGRPPHEPTEDTRRQVETMSGLGLPNRMIGAVLGLHESTVEKHYPDELERGAAKATAVIAQTLFNKAKGGDTASMLFWMKCRAGWREVQVHEHSGPGGGPIPVAAIVTDDPIEAAREYQRIMPGGA